MPSGGKKKHKKPSRKKSELDSALDIGHLFFFDLRLQVGIAKIMMGVRQNIDQHLPNRLNLDGLPPPLRAIYRDGHQRISGVGRWCRIYLIVIYAFIDCAAVDLRAVQLYNCNPAVCSVRQRDLQRLEKPLVGSHQGADGRRKPGTALSIGLTRRYCPLPQWMNSS